MWLCLMKAYILFSLPLVRGSPQQELVPLFSQALPAFAVASISIDRLHAVCSELWATVETKGSPCRDPALVVAFPKRTSNKSAWDVTIVKAAAEFLVPSLHFFFFFFL